jgi:RimJ/RimL family protein N-acetyltransferase
MPQIELGPFSRADEADAFELWSDYETVRFTNWTQTATRDECVERLERILARYAAEPRHFGPYAVRTGERRFVGLAGADLRDADSAAYEVWYVLRRDAWGRGIGNRALGELLRIMQASGRVRRAIATAVTQNVASWRLLDKHGFVREKVIVGGHQRHGLALDLFAYKREL